MSTAVPRPHISDETVNLDGVRALVVREGTLPPLCVRTYRDGSAVLEIGDRVLVRNRDLQPRHFGMPGLLKFIRDYLQPLCREPVTFTTHAAPERTPARRARETATVPASDGHRSPGRPRKVHKVPALVTQSPEGDGLAGNRRLD